MTGHRRTRASAASEAAGKVIRPVAKEGIAEEPVVVLDESDLESEVAKLRGRWELASVLNFLSVFEPVIGSDLKLSAEDIEMGLIKPDSSLAQLHIAILKVAEGEIPLMAAKGGEISRYKELDPTNRLLILKALCEVRADQDDTLSYINDALKQGNQISCFRKDKIGGDGNGITYWYDGNKTIGHRLYREVNMCQSRRNSKGKQCLSPPTISSRWETLATNLEEFHKVADELSCSKVVGEVDVGKTIETDAIPPLERLKKNKEMTLKRKQRQEMLLNNFWNPHGTGITRSCRTRRPISYTFDEYDRAIDEAIRLTKKGKTAIEQSQGGEDNDRNGGQETDTDSKDNSGKKGDSMDSDTESDVLQEVGIDDENKDSDYCGKMEDDIDDGGEFENSEDDGNHATMLHSQKRNGFSTQKLRGERWSKRLAGATSDLVAKTRTLGTNNGLRQSPTRNSAIDSFVVLDSEDEDVPENTKQGISEGETPSPGTDAEEVSGS
ncbi:hypothetical protein FH972_013230 [Carpinus fangiana]|uniref:DDT domain-containing protein n=1 Tax=Carpinus fangiana TaxID=176857 RepID=A0A5N6R9J8_9ROSI|nr:hypothetical protein FH972_013230 [Carpinus fangiana]